MMPLIPELFEPSYFLFPSMLLFGQSSLTPCFKFKPKTMGRYKLGFYRQITVLLMLSTTFTPLVSGLGEGCQDFEDSSVALCIWGWNGEPANDDDGVSGICKQITDTLPIKTYQSGYRYAVSWNPLTDDQEPFPNMFDEPFTTLHQSLLNILVQASGTQEQNVAKLNAGFLGVVGHSYGGWAAARLSVDGNGNLRRPDRTYLIDPVFGDSHSRLEDAKAYPLQGGISWYQNVGVLPADSCFFMNGCGWPCGYDGVDGLEDIKWNIVKDINCESKKVDCPFSKREQLTWHTQIDGDQCLKSKIVAGMFSGLKQKIASLGLKDCHTANPNLCQGDGLDHQHCEWDPLYEIGVWKCDVDSGWSPPSFDFLPGSHNDGTCSFKPKCYGYKDKWFPRLNKGCSDHGNCVTDDVCVCLPGFFGDRCEESIGSASDPPPLGALFKSPDWGEPTQLLFAPSADAYCSVEDFTCLNVPGQGPEHWPAGLDGYPTVSPSFGSLGDLVYLGPCWSAQCPVTPHFFIDPNPTFSDEPATMYALGDGKQCHVHSYTNAECVRAIHETSTGNMVDFEHIAEEKHVGRILDFIGPCTMEGVCGQSGTIWLSDEHTMGCSVHPDILDKVWAYDTLRDEISSKTWSDSVTDNIITRTWTFEPDHGDPIVESQIITVLPAIECPLDVDSTCDGDVSESVTGVATAKGTWNVHCVDFDVQMEDHYDINEYGVGTLYRKWYVTTFPDVGCVQKIKLWDSAVANLVVPPDAVMTCGVSTPDPGRATAVDGCGKPLPTFSAESCDEFTETRSWWTTPRGPTVYGTQTITWTAEAQCPSDVTMECGDSLATGNTGYAKGSYVAPGRCHCSSSGYIMPGPDTDVVVNGILTSKLRTFPGTQCEQTISLAPCDDGIPETCETCSGFGCRVMFDCGNGDCVPGEPCQCWGSWSLDGTTGRCTFYNAPDDYGRVAVWHATLFS